MARACGIRLGAKRYELVVLEGSVKAPKVKLKLEGELPHGLDPLEGASEVLREQLKAHKFPTDNVALAIDGGLAAYRSVTLPFDDKSKAEQVIKFEVESDLPQWDIDDVVVDFHVLSSTGAESNVLVTAVPKNAISDRIGACQDAGFEPMEVELEGTALVNAAQFAGVLAIDAAQVLVYVGEASTSVVVVDGGQVRAMRAIQLGTGVYQEPPVVDPDAEEGVEATAELPTEHQREQRLAEVRERLQRELNRTVAAVQTAHPVEVVYVSGGEVPGLVGSTAVDATIERLELYPGGGDGDTPVVAFGTAWRQLGGGLLQPELRREELKYAGKLERLELPLAVLGLLIVTLFAVKYIVVHKQIGWRGEGNLEINDIGDMQVWLVANNRYLETKLPDMPDSLRKDMRTAQEGKDEQRTKFQELRKIESMLTDEIGRVQKVLGQDSDIEKPQSALQASTLVLSLLKEVGSGGRYSMRELSATFQPARRGRTEDSVIVKMDLTFFGDPVTATELYTRLRNQLSNQIWCANVEEEASENLDEGDGIFVEGFTCVVDTSKAPVRQASN